MSCATMERPEPRLAVRLAQHAIEDAPDHAFAVSALLSAAVSILAERMPPDAVAALIGQAIDQAAADHRRANAH